MAHHAKIREERLRREQARRALLDLEELVVDVLGKHPEGLYPYEIGVVLDILPLKGRPLYGTNRTDVVWGILNGLVSEGLVEKRDSKASLTTPID